MLDARDHIDELQSLRGIAALMVAISHISSIYALPPRVASHTFALQDLIAVGTWNFSLVEMQQSPKASGA
jgi:peptidoglycan/LPS O-acetylase OafA/YrhL